MNTVKTALEFIHSLGKFSGKPGLHRIRALCAALGDPQKNLKFVHIAGTNGKGSTACMLASALSAAGLRTGLFTSPYIIKFNERIRVDGVMIPDAELIHFANLVSEAAESIVLPAGESIGEFEFVTAMGFLYFLEQECDIVVLETGLGGRYDASNVISSPEVCVITPLSLDHTKVLGNSIEKIAFEKAGIIKKGAYVVCAADQLPQAQKVIKNACMTAEAYLYPNPAWYTGYVVSHDYSLLRCDVEGSAFRYEGQGYFIPMPGFHQIKNALTALDVLAALRERGWDIPVFSAVKGLAQARMPGRLEKLRDNPLVLLDGAHNPDGIKALRRFIDDMLKMRRLKVVMGMMCDKNYELCIQAIASRADEFFACSLEDDPRALSTHAIAELAKLHCEKVYDCGGVKQALLLALTNAHEKDCVLVCGSLYIIGEAEKILRSRQKTAE